MYAKGVKLVSIAAFFLMFIGWFVAKNQLWSVGDGGYMELLALAVFLAALLLVAQTALGGKYLWAVAFAGIAVLFNLSRFRRGLHVGFHPLTYFVMART